jgi:hypothetical protein
MAWGLWKLGSAFDGAGAVAGALERYRATPDFRSDPHPPSLLCGETGILVAAERVGSPAADRERLRELIRANRSHPTWELLWGSPGTMLAARALGLDDEWRDSAELLWAQWDEDTDLWTQHLYGHVIQSLGPGHGFAGNVNAWSTGRRRPTTTRRRSASSGATGHPGSSSPSATCCRGSWLWPAAS